MEYARSSGFLSIPCFESNPESDRGRQACQFRAPFVTRCTPTKPRPFSAYYGIKQEGGGAAACSNKGPVLRKTSHPAESVEHQVRGSLFSKASGRLSCSSSISSTSVSCRHVQVGGSDPATDFWDGRPAGPAGWMDRRLRCCRRGHGSANLKSCA